MFDTYEWNNIEGEGKSENLTLFSLSTCGFCTSARKYLVGRGLSFRYLDLDSLSPDKKIGDYKRIPEQIRTQTIIPLPGNRRGAFPRRIHQRSLGRRTWLTISVNSPKIPRTRMDGRYSLTRIFSRLFWTDW